MTWIPLPRPSGVPTAGWPAALVDRVQLARVASELPLTLRAADDQRQVTAAVVLAIAVLGGVLAVTALVLAGRLTAGIRADETALRSALGTSRRQLAATATLEARRSSPPSPPRSRYRPRRPCTPA